MIRRDLLLTTVVLLLLLAAAAWLLRESGSDGDANADAQAGFAAPAVVGRASDAATAEAPDLAAGQLAALAAESVRSPGVQRLATGRTPGADTSWTDAREISFRGSVLDERGAPLAGAVVVYWPNDVTQALYGVDEFSRGAALDGLPRALTGADGRFDVRGRQREGRGAAGLHDLPSLVVIAGEHAIRSHACAGIGSGVDCDAGDIAMERGGRLVGRVVDSAGRFIAGATVVPWSAVGLSLEAGELPVDGAARGVTRSGCLLAAAFAATTSEADGRFETGPLWPGSTHFSVTAQGFQPLVQNARALRTSPTDVGEIVLLDGLVLAGVVVDDRGAPVPGASVLAWKILPNASEARLSGDGDVLLKLLKLRATIPSTFKATADSRGRFAFDSLTPGSHDAIVDAEGFEPLPTSASMPCGSAERVLRLVRAATLRLNVVDAASHVPLAAATVTARRFTGEKLDTEGVALPVSRTGAPGTLLVGRLGLHRTLLSIGAPGFATKSLELPGATPPEQIELTVALESAATISGKVITREGAGLVGAQVVATSAAADAPAPTRVATDARGCFDLEALAAGEWSLRAEAEGFEPVERTLRLAASERRAHIDFVLPGAGVVFGSCFQADGTPKSLASVWLNWLDAQGDPQNFGSRKLTTDADGHYELTGMRLGTWRSKTMPPVEFTLAAGERRQVDFRDDPPTSVQGRVLQGNGLPVPDAWVFVHWTKPGGRDRITQSLRADRDGAFLWDRDRPGHVELVAASPTQGMTQAAVLELQPGEHLVVNLILGTAGVAGRVLRVGDEAPVGGASVRLLPLLEGDVAGLFDTLAPGGESATFGVARTDGDGRFVLHHVAPGRYSVAVESVGACAGPLPPLTVGAAGVSDLLLRVAARGSLSGTVRHASGEAWKDEAWVTADGPDGRRFAQTINGRFELGDLAPGDWRLTMKPVKGPRIEQHVTVLSGQWIAVELIVP